MGLPTCPTATLPLATTLLTPLVLATLLRGRLRLMPTMAPTVMEDSVLTATEVMVPDMTLFLPLAHPLLLEPMPPPPLLEHTSPTADSFGAVHIAKRSAEPFYGHGYGHGYGYGGYAGPIATGVSTVSPAGFPLQGYAQGYGYGHGYGYGR